MQGQSSWEHLAHGPGFESNKLQNPRDTEYSDLGGMCKDSFHIQLLSDPYRGKEGKAKSPQKCLGGMLGHLGTGGAG